jgi:pimeloyl-ACP methyl ester carboxylesterase
MRYPIIALLAGLLFTLSACQKSEFLSEGDFFHLDHDGSRMPIWVKGNFNSDVILLTLHGGPGGEGMTFHLSNGFKMLEEDYLCVYWDQRFSGMAQGHTDVSTLHPDQFIEDTEKVVQLIQHKYPGKKLFILGHSWGGQLSAGYLGRDNHDDNFRGWINLDGSIFGELEAQLMKEWIMERIPDKMADPNADHAFWQYIIDWYEANPAPGNNEPQPYWYVSAFGGDAYNWEQTQAENPIPYGELIFRSMFSMSFYIYSFGQKEHIQAWDELDYTPELANITIPSLMLWGAEDGIVPTGVAHYVYEHLGTPEADKEVLLIPECGHSPQNDQPEAFYQEMRDFMERYK